MDPQSGMVRMRTVDNRDGYVDSKDFDKIHNPWQLNSHILHILNDPQEDFQEELPGLKKRCAGMKINAKNFFSARALAIRLQIDREDTAGRTRPLLMYRVLKETKSFSKNSLVVAPESSNGAGVVAIYGLDSIYGIEVSEKRLQLLEHPFCIRISNRTSGIGANNTAVGSPKTPAASAQKSPAPKSRTLQSTKVSMAVKILNASDHQLEVWFNEDDETEIADLAWQCGLFDEPASNTSKSRLKEFKRSKAKILSDLRSLFPPEPLWDGKNWRVILKELIDRGLTELRKECESSQVKSGTRTATTARRLMAAAAIQNSKTGNIELTNRQPFSVNSQSLSKIDDSIKAAGGQSITLNTPPSPKNSRVGLKLPAPSNDPGNGGKRQRTNSDSNNDAIEKKRSKGSDTRRKASSVHLLIAFFEGNGVDHRGRSHKAILSLSDDLIESTHDFIQWLFPLPESSNFNRNAPLLDRSVIRAFEERLELRRTLRAGFERMLRFYGFELVVDDRKPLVSVALSREMDVLSDAEIS